MKNLIVLVLVLGFTISAHSQIRKIPSAVTEAFKSKYPTAANVEWRDNISNFSATFQLDSVKGEAEFNGKGKWLETELWISTDSIPAEVLDGFKKSKYGDWEIKQARRIDLPKDVIKYRIEAEKTDVNKRVLIFNNNGKLLKSDYTL